MKLLLISLLTFFTANLTYAGNLQGGGGGPQNVSIKRFLDKRLYALDGANKFIVPRVNILNACKHQSTINTINKVWGCKELLNNRSSSCTKKVKRHFQHSIMKTRKQCLATKLKKFDTGIVKKVCTDWAEPVTYQVPLSYKLDVYSRDIGERGTPLIPNLEHDIFVTEINYQIPNCTDVVID